MGAGLLLAQDYTAEMAFNQAANQYIAGNNQAARQAVNQGLKYYPGNTKLRRLKEKLEEQEKQQQEQQKKSTEPTRTTTKSGPGPGPTGKR